MPPTPLLLLDGGLGTTLESPPFNITFSPLTPLWSAHLLIASPQTLLAAHRAFVANGADVLLTATYQASPEGFAATRRVLQTKNVADDKPSGPVATGEEILGGEGYGLEEAATIMRSAVQIAVEALTGVTPQAKSGRKGRVALSLGAYGATMRPSTEYSGAYFPPHMATAEGLRGWHATRLELFKHDPMTWKEIDLVAFETLPVIEEVQAVRKIMRGAERAKNWWVSCVFRGGERGNVLPDGTSVGRVVEAMLGDDEGVGEPPWGIGVNCTEAGKLGELVLELETEAERVLSEGRSKDKVEWPWLVIYPDGARGLVYNTSTQAWEAADSSHPPIPKEEKEWDEEMAQVVEQTMHRARWKGILVGGCCKTSPADIGKLRRRLDSLGKPMIEHP